ncbi:hypothetical protein [Kitasatospora sp. LaBMicrA B282]|uniref:hypothetical protein n=1 Tax=Kitasatospora sp. LaBMicrA B282 TaxID=3420949 RepID=UPI003D11083A
MMIMHGWETWFVRTIAAAGLAAVAVAGVIAANAGYGPWQTEAGPHPFIHVVHVSAEVSADNAAGTVWPDQAAGSR